MKIVVTGATGFIGSHLVERLCEDGCEVIAPARSADKAAFVTRLGARPVIGDLHDRSAMERAVEGADLVVHLAGRVKARGEAEYLRVNRDGTRLLVDAARRAGNVRLLLVSSLAAAGPSSPGRRRTEEEPEQPVTAYGRSKLAAEEAVRASGLPWTIVRPPMVYGPRDVEVLKLFKIARRGFAPVFGDGAQELSAVYVTDLVEALVACASADAALARTYSACHPEVFTSLDLVRAVARVLGREVRVLHLSPAVVRGMLSLIGSVAGLVGKATMLNRDKANEFLAPAWTGDPAPLEKETGWRAAHDLSAGLKATAAWYREQAWLP